MTAVWVCNEPRHVPNQAERDVWRRETPLLTRCETSDDVFRRQARKMNLLPDPRNLPGHAASRLYVKNMRAKHNK